MNPAESNRSDPQAPDLEDCVRESRAFARLLAITLEAACKNDIALCDTEITGIITLERTVSDRLSEALEAHLDRFSKICGALKSRGGFEAIGAAFGTPSQASPKGSAQ